MTHDFLKDTRDSNSESFIELSSSGIKRSCFQIISCLSDEWYQLASLRSGSGATGLALKDADIDLVVLGVGPKAIEGGGGGFSKADRGDLVKALRKIKDTLYRDKIVWKATVISTAKVGGGAQVELGG